jgi:hypothetical protein
MPASGREDRFCLQWLDLVLALRTSRQGDVTATSRDLWPGSSTRALSEPPTNRSELSSRSSRSGSRLAAPTRNSTPANRVGDAARKPATSTLTSEISSARAAIAARRLLIKQPPIAARNSSPPIGPVSVPPFPAGLSMSTRCRPIVASDVEAEI